MSDGAVLDGVLERVTFANPETGYTIGTIAPERDFWGRRPLPTLISRRILAGITGLVIMPAPSVASIGASAAPYRQRETDVGVGEGERE
jgi:hypothetical protein